MDLKLALRPAVQCVRGSLSGFRTRLSCGRRGVVIARRVSLSDVRLSDYVNIAHDAELANVSLGKRTSVGRFTKIRDAEIGSYCSISWNVTIGAVSHPMDHPSSHSLWYRRQFGIVGRDTMLPIEKALIGNDVWIGCDVVVMPGVTVGDGAVLGANAVVTKDVEPYAIMAGSPARKIGSRFDEGEIAKLEEIRWWDWDDATIKANLDFFEKPFGGDIPQIPARLTGQEGSVCSA